MALAASLALSWPAAGQEAAPPPPPIPDRLASAAAPPDSAEWERPGTTTVAQARTAALETSELLKQSQSQRETIRGLLADQRALLDDARQNVADLKVMLAQAPAPPRPSATIVDEPAKAAPAPPAPAPNPTVTAAPQSQAVQAPATPAKSAPVTQAVEAPAATMTTTSFTGPGRVRRPGPLRGLGAMYGDLLVGMGTPLQHLRDVKVVSYIPQPAPARVTTTAQTTVQAQHIVIQQPVTPPPSQAVMASAPLATPQAAVTTTTTTSSSPSRLWGVGIFRR